MRADDPNLSPDVLHLSFLPPYVPGSYNRFLGAYLREDRGVPQAMLSYETAARPPGDPWGERLVLVGPGGLSARRRLVRRLPERWRGRSTNGISGRDTIVYAWKARDAVESLRPRVVVCWDARKLGAFLRPSLDPAARLVLAQRGFSYHLEPREADRTWSRAAFDAVWAQSLASYRFDRQRAQLYEPSVTVLSTGIDTDAFRPASDEERRAARRGFGLPPDRPVVLVLSRLVPKKGAHLLVESWDRVVAKAPGALLWVVGAGDPAFRASLEATARRLGVADSVRFEGAVPPERTADCYRAADVYVFPTLCGEGQARTLLEAMACGLPCVTSDRPEARETYRDGEVVFVPDPNVSGAFVAPIVSLLGDPARRAAFGRDARSAAVSRFREADCMAALTAWLGEHVRLAGPRA